MPNGARSRILKRQSVKRVLCTRGSTERRQQQRNLSVGKEQQAVKENFLFCKPCFKECSHELRCARTYSKCYKAPWGGIRGPVADANVAIGAGCPGTVPNAGLTRVKHDAGHALRRRWKSWSVQLSQDVCVVQKGQGLARQSGGLQAKRRSLPEGVVCTTQLLQWLRQAAARCPATTALSARASCASIRRIQCKTPFSLSDGAHAKSTARRCRHHPMSPVDASGAARRHHPKYRGAMLRLARRVTNNCPELLRSRRCRPVVRRLWRLPCCRTRVVPCPWPPANHNSCLHFFHRQPRPVAVTCSLGHGLQLRQSNV